MGFSCLTVTTGSMQPSIDPGDVIIISNWHIGGLKKGDIATYVLEDGNMVTHRVVETKNKDGYMAYQFQGDANNIPDAEWIPSQDILGIYQLKIHKLAYVVNVLRSPLLILIILSLFLVNKLAKTVKKQLIQIKREEENNGQ